MVSEPLRHRLVVAALTAVLIAHAAVSHAQEEITVESIRQSGVWLDFNSGFRDLTIQTIAIDPENPQRMYAGGLGFIYRTTNGGDSWQVTYSLRVAGAGTPVSGREGRIDISDIEDLEPAVIDAVEERYEELQQDLYASVAQSENEYTAALVVEASADDLLERALEEVLAEEMPSGDADVFQPDPLVIPDNLFTHIVIDPDEPNRVFAASGRGVVYSEDYGATWTVLYRGVGNAQRRVRAIALAGDTILLATASGIRVSSDNGQSWFRGSGPPSLAAVRFVAASPSHPDRMYAIADGRVYRSADGGANWLPLDVPQGVPAGAFSNLAVHPDDPDIVYLGTGLGVMRSTNAGATFRLTSLTGLRERRVTWVSHFRDVLLVGTPDGFYISMDDAGSWDEISNGLSAALIRQIAISSAGRVWLATQTGVFQRVPQAELHPSMDTVRELQDVWAYEPDLGQTVEAAIRYNNYDEIESDSWSARIFWSRFLPRARFRYTMMQARDITETYIADDLTSLPVLEDRRFRTQEPDEFQFMVLWDIGRIVLDARQVSQRDVGDRQIRRRRDLIRRTIAAFDSRRELMFRMAAGEWTTLTRRVDDELSLAELTARLDALTGGYFSAYSEVHGR